MPSVKANPEYIHEEFVPTILKFLNGKEEKVFIFEHPVKENRYLIALKKSLHERFDDRIHNAFLFSNNFYTGSKTKLTFCNYFDNNFNESKVSLSYYTRYFENCEWVFTGVKYYGEFSLKEIQAELRRLRLYFENLNDVNIKFITER